MWDRQVDKCSPPFHKNLNGSIEDSEGKCINLYPEAENCLNLLLSAKIPIGVASRISDAAGAYQLLHLLNIRNFFDFVEIYPTGKRLHFMRMKKKSGINFEEITFYDDDERNIRDISKLGVNCVLVENGLSLNYLKPIINVIHHANKN